MSGARRVANTAYAVLFALFWIGWGLSIFWHRSSWFAAMAVISWTGCLAIHKWLKRRSPTSDVLVGEG